MPALVEAFDRLLIDPVETDKGCRGKAAIVRALRELERDDVELYLRGVAHLQHEPVWGGTVDTAGDLRAACGLGLVESGDRRALRELAALLADAVPSVRVAAAKGLAELDADGAVAVLRLKAALGDEDQTVLGECFTALLALDPEGSCAFLASYLARTDAAEQEIAALALGESRLEPAFEVLKRWYADLVLADDRRAALTAIALLRREAAFAFLMSEIENGSSSTARVVVDALSIYAPDEALRERALTAATAGGHAELAGVIAEQL